MLVGFFPRYRARVQYISVMYKYQGYKLEASIMPLTLEEDHSNFPCAEWRAFPCL